MIISNSLWKYCTLAGSWPIGQLLLWMQRSNGQVDRHTPYKRMHEQNIKITFCNIYSTFIIKTWWNVHNVHSLWQLKWTYTLHFFALWTPFGIQHKWPRVFQNPKWIEYLRSASKKSWWCLTCWTLKALSAASSDIVCHKHTPIVHLLKNNLLCNDQFLHVVMQIKRWELLLAFPLAHKQEK